MARQLPSRRDSAHRCAGFGLIDALVALVLLALTLLGACASLHFALRSTRAASWHSRAVDLGADLDEDLHLSNASRPLQPEIDSWERRLQLDLPAARILGLVPRSLLIDEREFRWMELKVAWNALPGQPQESLLLPLPNAVAP